MIIWGYWTKDSHHRLDVAAEVPHGRVHGKDLVAHVGPTLQGGTQQGPRWRRLLGCKAVTGSAGIPSRLRARYSYKALYQEVLWRTSTGRVELPYEIKLTLKLEKPTLRLWSCCRDLQ